MSERQPAPDDEGETYQEGVSPVQSFTSEAIPVGPDTVLEPRRGRPARGGAGLVRAGVGIAVGATFGMLFWILTRDNLKLSIRGEADDAYSSLQALVALGVLVGGTVGVLNGLMRNRPG